MKKTGFWIARGLKIVVLGGAFVVLAGFAVMGLWNWLMPAIFGWSSITWLQALGLLALAKILFGGPRWGRHGWQGGHHRHAHWRRKFEQRWEQMSEEERAKVRARWGHRCGGYPWDLPEDKPATGQEDKVAG